MYLDCSCVRSFYRWLQNIYYAFAYPYLLYDIEIYANTYASYLDKLVKINNKILRILLNQPIYVLPFHSCMQKSIYCL